LRLNQFVLRKHITCLSGILVFLWWSVSVTWSANLAIEPTVEQVTCAPSRTVHGRFRVTNQSDERAVIIVEPEDWLARWKVSDRPQLKDWLQVKPDKFTLGPGTSRWVKYRVRVSQDASGELMAMLFFSSQSDTDKKSPLRIKTRIGVSLCVFVEGTQKYNAKIEKIEASRKGNTLSTVVVVRNLGNFHIKPKGVILITTSDGQEVAEFEVQPRTVYPDSKRGLVGYHTFSDLASGVYQTRVELEVKLPDGQVKNLTREQWFEISESSIKPVSDTHE